MIDPGDVIILMGIQRSGTHMLGAAIATHPAMKYTGEIFHQVYPRNRDRVLRGVDRCRAPGLLVCVDVKYNQMTPALEGFARECRGVIHLLRRDTFALYFSGALHTYYGMNPEAQKRGHVPVLTFNEQTYHEIMRERRAWIAKYSRLETLRLVYEDLTGGQEVRQIPEWAGRQICAMAGVEYEPLTVPFGKDAPVNYRDFLRFPAGCKVKPPEHEKGEGQHAEK